MPKLGPEQQLYLMAAFTYLEQNYLLKIHPSSWLSRDYILLRVHPLYQLVWCCCTRIFRKVCAVLESTSHNTTYFLPFQFDGAHVNFAGSPSWTSWIMLTCLFLFEWCCHTIDYHLIYWKLRNLIKRTAGRRLLWPHASLEINCNELIVCSKPVLHSFPEHTQYLWFFFLNLLKE